MKTIYLLFVFLFISTGCFSQQIIEWKPDFSLELADFQSPNSEIDKGLEMMSIHSGATLNFTYQMSNYEFMLTKNFNSKISANFNKSLGTIVAPDSVNAKRLLNFGNYDFDLTELYARKLRKSIYENKKTFSSSEALLSLYEKTQIEMRERSSKTMKETNFGEKAELLKNEHNLVLKEIEKLAEFCKECKISKKKKNKK